jgi:hypothetical protein
MAQPAARNSARGRPGPRGRSGVVMRDDMGERNAHRGGGCSTGRTQSRNDSSLDSRGASKGPQDRDAARIAESDLASLATPDLLPAPDWWDVTATGEPLPDWVALIHDQRAGH